MAIRVPSSRQQLTWFKFDQKTNGSWVINIAPPYHEVFSIQEQDIIKQSNTGWLDSKGGKTKFAFFRGLNAEQILRIEQFSVDYERIVLISLNRTIRDAFTDELDACLALDYTMASAGHGDRTEIGQLEYEAKYKGSNEAFNRLAHELYRGLRRLPTKLDEEELWISHVPADPNSEPSLSTKLARALVNLSTQRGPWDSVRLVESTLTCKKLKAKDLKWKRKLAMWQRFVKKGQIELHCSVEGRQLVVVDDLYQSGATLWSYAQFLKQVGAREVLGLVCTKSWGDTDNK